MSYVGGPFRHDIFISYSHGTSPDGQAMLRGWSQQFASLLDRELRLNAQYGSVRIFFDGDSREGHGVDPIAPLTAQLEGDLRHSALLLILMSPQYLTSPWCTREREAWAAAQEEPDLATPQRVPVGLEMRRRIPIVRILPTEKMPWPALLVDQSGEQLVGFEMFARSERTPVRPLGYVNLPGHLGSQFMASLLELINPICHRLDTIKARIDSAKQITDSASRLAMQSGQSVYLHARIEDKAIWEERANALLAQSYSVFPGEPDSSPRSDFRKAQEASERRIEALTYCDAMLLLGQDGGSLDADLLAVAKHDRNSARARSQRELPCGLLDTVGPAIGTAVRRKTVSNLQADWLDGTQPDWLAGVGRWLAERGARALAKL